MSKRKCMKYIGLCSLILVVAIVMTISITAIRVDVKTKRLSDDYQYLYHDDRFKEAHNVSSLEVIKQDISCGYAVIEMIANWEGLDVSEEKLYETYGMVVTSTGKSFEKEMNKQFKEYRTTMYKYQTNSQMLEKIYVSLSEGIPVPFEWAAMLDDTWTLHYSIITGIDFNSNQITVCNPYGYIENLSIEEFLKRTSFEAYKNMPLFLKFGFMFDVFEKNTIFIMERI